MEKVDRVSKSFAKSGDCEGVQASGRKWFQLYRHWSPAMHNKAITMTLLPDLNKGTAYKFGRLSNNGR